MTTSVQGGGSGGDGGGGDERENRKRAHDEVGKDEIKEKVTANATKKIKTEIKSVSSDQKKVRVRPGGFFGQSMGLRAATPEVRQQRAAQAQAAEQARQAAAQSIADEFWGAYEGDFTRTAVSAGRHLRGGSAPDGPTIAFFANQTPEEWLDAQPRGAFVLTRSDSEVHGASIIFTVFFLTDRQPRRSVTGHFQNGEFKIIHIGPVQ